MIRRTLAGCLLFVPSLACSSTDTPGGAASNPTSGTGGAANGGPTGGSVSSGGATSAGGTISTAAGAPTNATGGSPSSGATAGSPASMGGAPSSAGGAPAGGAPASGGGAAPNGGKASAGAPTAAGESSGGAGSSGGSGGAPSGSVGELPGSACTREFKVPAFSELKTNAKMPDPFTFLDGTKVQSKDDWVCRQKEISQLAQAFIYGPKPGKPEKLTASFSGGNLTVDMESGGRTWSFSVAIKTPTGDGPFPALFDVDAGAPSGIASIGTGLNWLTSNVAAAGSGRGARGKFYDFHPNSTDTGSLMAWAWVASRIIDGLEITEGHKIDTKKLYGLGCSRNGKTSATMALFDQRMAMVAMLSPGSGSTSGWRPAEAATGSVQRAGQIFGETTWMGEPFGQFGDNVDKLPIDQHAVLALAWPRPLLVREGTDDSWNCPACVYTTVKYTQLVYEALGNKDAVGFTHYNGGHCASGGTEWTTTYDAFIKKYLQGDSATSTAGMFTESRFTFDKAKWQDGELMAIP